MSERWREYEMVEEERMLVGHGWVLPTLDHSVGHDKLQPDLVLPTMIVHL